MKKVAKDQLTPKEEEVMQLLWEHGPILISKLVELYPDPKPHFNTVSTVVRRLETKRNKRLISLLCQSRKRIFQKPQLWKFHQELFRRKLLWRRIFFGDRR